MKKYPASVFIAFFAVAFLVTGMVIVRPYLQESRSAKEHESYNEILQSNLANEVSQYKKGEIHTINFAETFQFSWDKVFFFGPYTSPSRINFILGYSWPRVKYLQIRYDESVTLIVFTKEGRVVEYLEYRRDLGDFSNLKTYTSGIPTNEANFVMDENGILTLLSKEE